MRKGFSLVELAIVLVILGLLAGGILAGQSLIKAAELKAVTTELQKYQNATITFRTKYDALPGDFANATSTWGTSPGGCPGTSATGSTDARTCNGDDSGTIDNHVAYESYRYWHHLANAGLIEGNFSGVSGSAGNNYTDLVGTNVPKSGYPNGGWHMLYRLDSWAGSAGFEYAGAHGHVFFFGAPATNSLSGHDLLSPTEAWNIDTKIDDGKGGMGNVIAVSYTGCTSAANVTDFAADYILTESGKTCALQFRHQFQKK